MEGITFDGRGYTKLVFAEQKAQDASKLLGTVYVIASKIWNAETRQRETRYFCNGSGIMRNGEELKSIWYSGKKR